MIRYENVSMSYVQGHTELKVLSEITFAVDESEFVALVGPSGCGKTTLLMMAAGLVFPVSGQVWCNDVVVTGPGAERAVVFQQFALFPWKTVLENVSFGMRCLGLPKKTINERASHYVELMGLSRHRNAYPHQLSGGMQQRVAIARSYAVQPSVLLMDEPFGALDAQTRENMQVELLRINRGENRSTLFVTHSVEEAVYLADRVVILSRGPAKISAVIDVKDARTTGRWAELAIEEVITQEAFNDLRSRVSQLIHGERAPPVAKEGKSTSDVKSNRRRT